MSSPVTNATTVKLAVIGIASLAAMWWAWPSSPVRHPPGVPVAPDQPEQVTLKETPAWTHDDYLITGLATYRIRAKVLSRERYYIDDGSDLSPIDLALAWGPLSEQTAIDMLDVTQGHRWYEWYTDEPPLPLAEISANSANVHMLPATDELRDALLDVRVGELIELAGYLVHVEGDDGYQWHSSLTRTDTGDGACEVFWVEELRRGFKPGD